MQILKLIILTTAIILIAMLALSVRLIFKPKGDFHGGSCSNQSKELRDKNIGCGCGHSNGCIAE